MSDYTDSEQGQYDVLSDQDETEQSEKMAYALAVQIHDAAFQILDAIPELDGAVAGVIAKAVQDVAERELIHTL